jgi:hypothetical protein
MVHPTNKSLAMAIHNQTVIHQDHGLMYVENVLWNSLRNHAGTITGRGAIVQKMELLNHQGASMTLHHSPLDQMKDEIIQPKSEN